MRQREPLGQLLRRLIRSMSVEGHHRGRNARRPQELRAPSVADGHDLDEVRAPADGLFEAMDGHVVLCV